MVADIRPRLASAWGTGIWKRQTKQDLTGQSLWQLDMSRELEVAPMTRLYDESKRSFASDNYSGVHPKVLAAIESANGGHVSSHGNDPYTEKLHSRRKVIAENATSMCGMKQLE